MKMINTGNEWAWIDEMKSMQYQKVLDEMKFLKLKVGFIGENDKGRLIFSEKSNDVANIEVTQNEIKEVIQILQTPQDER